MCAPRWWAILGALMAAAIAAAAASAPPPSPKSKRPPSRAGKTRRDAVPRTEERGQRDPHAHTRSSLNKIAVPRSAAPASGATTTRTSRRERTPPKTSATDASESRRSSRRRTTTRRSSVTQRTSSFTGTVISANGRGKNKRKRTTAKGNGVVTSGGGASRRPGESRRKKSETPTNAQAEDLKTKVKTEDSKGSTRNRARPENKAKARPQTPTKDKAKVTALETPPKNRTKNEGKSPDKSPGKSPRAEPAPPKHRRRLSRIPVLASVDIAEIIRERQAREDRAAEESEEEPNSRTRLPIMRTSSLKTKRSLLKGSPHLRSRSLSQIEIPTIGVIAPPLELKPPTKQRSPPPQFPEPEYAAPPPPPPKTLPPPAASLTPSESAEEKSGRRTPSLRLNTSVKLTRTASNASVSSASSALSLGPFSPDGMATSEWLARHALADQFPGLFHRRGSSASIPTTPSRLRESFIAEEDAEDGLSPSGASPRTIATPPRVLDRDCELDDAPIYFLHLLMQKIDVYENATITITEMRGGSASALSYLSTRMDVEINRAIRNAVPMEVLIGDDEVALKYRERIFYIQSAIQLIQAGWEYFKRYYGVNVSAKKRENAAMLHSLQTLLDQIFACQQIQMSKAQSAQVEFLPPVQLDLSFLQGGAFEDSDEMHKLALRRNSQRRHLYS